MTDHVQIQEAIAAYVMHSIDPDDRARTEHELLDHLPGCESCSALMRDLRELSGDLGAVLKPAHAHVSPAALFGRRTRPRRIHCRSFS